MVESQNKKVDYSASATWFRGLPTYGKVLIGDRAFEFYSNNNVDDYVQIPWDTVALVVADVHFKGKYIPRFKFVTKKDGEFTFVTKDPKAALRAVRNYIPAQNIRKALTFSQRLKRIFVRR